MFMYDIEMACVAVFWLACGPWFAVYCIAVLLSLGFIYTPLKCMWCWWYREMVPILISIGSDMIVSVCIAYGYMIRWSENQWPTPSPLAFQPTYPFVSCSTVLISITSQLSHCIPQVYSLSTLRVIEIVGKPQTLELRHHNKLQQRIG